MFSSVATDLGPNTSPGAQRKNGKVRSPLIVDFGNSVDNIYATIDFDPETFRVRHKRLKLAFCSSE